MRISLKAKKEISKIFVNALFKKLDVISIL